MKNKLYHNWTEEVFNSMSGSQRAKPDKDLLTRIEQGLEVIKGKNISLNQLRYLAAAAIVLLFLNTMAMYQINQSAVTHTAESDISSNTTLISNYKIYE